MSVPYVKGSDTSRAAAESIDATTLRQQVLSFIASRGEQGATDDEVEVGLGMSHQTASARRRELAIEGRVYGSEHRRRTRSNREATVWLLTPDADVEYRKMTVQDESLRDRLIAAIRKSLPLEDCKSVAAFIGLDDAPEAEPTSPFEDDDFLTGF